MLTQALIFVNFVYPKILRTTFYMSLKIIFTYVYKSSYIVLKLLNVISIFENYRAHWSSRALTFLTVKG
jgi:hypothetical protein